MYKFLWLLCGAALMLVACAKNDTEVVSVWKDETKTGKIKKVALEKLGHTHTHTHTHTQTHTQHTTHMHTCAHHKVFK
jgi:hypothetical protein